VELKAWDDKHKHAPAVDGVQELFLRRWSPRAFAAKPVSREDLRTLFEAARWSASSYNEQPWRFLVGVKGDATYQKIYDALVEFNQQWAGHAPVLILSAARKQFSHNGAPNQYALYDTGAATALLMLQATHLGLHAHSMAGFDHAKARAAFGIPENFEVGAVTAVGYLGDPEMLPEGMREQEKAPRGRKPVEEIVFSAWETPAAF
jgi:nitroreductase